MKFLDKAIAIDLFAPAHGMCVCWTTFEHELGTEGFLGLQVVKGGTEIGNDPSKCLKPYG